MTKKYFTVGCLLLQCLAMTGMDKSSDKKSSDKAGHSPKFLSRSQEELEKDARRALAGAYFSGYCGNPRPGFDKNKLKPLPQDDHDCLFI